jgi:hypothetical protein
MSNQRHSINFYMELKDQKSPKQVAKKKSDQARTTGLSEAQLAKLSEDLRRPMKDSSSASNPMQ